jgi:hypothetical protein
VLPTRQEQNAHAYVVGGAGHAVSLIPEDSQAVIAQSKLHRPILVRGKDEQLHHYGVIAM